MPNSRWCYIIGTLFPSALFILGLPWLFSWWRIRLQCRRPWFNSWVEKILWRRDRLPTPVFLGFPDSSPNAGDLGLIPGLGRSPGEGKSYPLRYSGLENSMDNTVHAITKSQTQLSDFHFHLYSLFAKLKWFSLKLLALFCSKYIHFYMTCMDTSRSVASLKPHYPDASTWTWAFPKSMPWLQLFTYPPLQESLFYLL